LAVEGDLMDDDLRMYLIGMEERLVKHIDAGFEEMAMKLPVALAAG
jgi:hypothetical protein